MLFSGKQYNVEALKTCMGSAVLQASHCSMLITGASEAAAFKHFQKVAARCPLLQHGNVCLIDHIQV